MSKKEAAKRYLLFVVGLFFMSLGTALITKTGLGTSPNSSIAYVLSLRFSPSLGTFITVFNVALIILYISLIVRLWIL